MGGVDVDDVEPGFGRTPRRRLVICAKGGDVGLVHPTGVDGNLGAQGGCCHWARDWQAGMKIAAAHAAMRDFDARKGAMLLDRFNLPRMGGDVAVIPETVHLVIAHIAVRANLGHLGADDAPPAFGLHRP